MKYYALGTIAVALAVGVPTASGVFVVSSSTSAQADIVCGRLGCRETGRTIRRNGSYYRGLGFGSQTQNQPKADSTKQQSR
jgi:hypothetical protein